MGMPAVPMNLGGSAPQEAARREVSAAHVETADSNAGQRTMLDMPPPSPPSEPEKAAKRTMMGMAPVPSPVASEPSPVDTVPEQKTIEAREASAPAPTSPATSESAGPAKQQKPSPNTNRTMLGMAQPPPQAQKPAGNRRKPIAPSNRTMLGVAQPPQPGQVAEDYDDEEVVATPAKSSPIRGILIGLFALTLLAGLGALGWYFLSKGPELSASIAEVDGAEVLRIGAPSASEGSKIRFDGTEVALVNGVAEIPLEGRHLNLGENPLSLELVSASGDAESAEVILDIAYRVRADVSGLSATPPRIAVVVDAAPGSTVTLAEAPLTLDTNGHGEYEVPLALDADTPEFSAEIAYVVNPPNAEASTGSVRLRIPRATLDVDRPGARTVTDQDAVSVAGVAANGATLTLDGNAISVEEGRFEASIDSSATGEQEHVLEARQEGTIPRRRVFQVQRVNNLAEVAASYEIDESLTYARIAEDPNAHRGGRVAFVGQVYNVNVQGGETTLQMVVQGCARGEQCPLWVVYPSAANIELRSWVKVYGELAGEQQYRAVSGEVQTDPRVNASFVIPQEEPRRTRRRRRRR